MMHTLILPVSEDVTTYQIACEREWQVSAMVGSRLGLYTMLWNS